MTLETNIKKPKNTTLSLKEKPWVNWGALKPILGQVPDVLIAECYGVSRERVRQIRKSFNIQLKSKLKAQVRIPVSDLKKYSLVQLAVKYGVHTYQVSEQRAIHGISKKRSTITSKLDRLFARGVHLGMTDHEIAHKMGCSISQVQKRRLEMGYYKRKYRTTGSRHSK